MKSKILIICAGVTVSFMVLMCMGVLMANATPVGVSATVAATVTLDMPVTAVNFGGGNLSAGQVYTQNDITATVSSNNTWVLNVNKGGVSGDLVGATPPPDTIPSANFTYTSASADPKVTDKRTSNTQFPAADDWSVKGNRGGAILSTISYRLDVPWEVKPDSYTATHTYTAIQP